MWTDSDTLTLSLIIVIVNGIIILHFLVATVLRLRAAYYNDAETAERPEAVTVHAFDIHQNEIGVNLKNQSARFYYSKV